MRVNEWGLVTDLQDYYVPNGDHKGTRYEVLSYLTNVKKYIETAKYQRPPERGVSSETEGRGELYVIGDSWTNIPSLYRNYIDRPEVEEELCGALTNQHPVVCLIGRGGIGKTSVAVKVLHSVAENSTYEIILWVSARDIDLHDGYYRIVEPQILEKKDIAKIAKKLMLDPESPESEEPYFEGLLRGEHYDKPILLVIDNYETVRDQYGLYYYLQENVRHPNKVLLTTRKADYRGQYPVYVSGMSEQESEALIRSESSRKNILHLLSDKYIKEIQMESEGHPYIMKIHLGEVAASGEKRSIEHVVSSKDELLDALFERTYSRLSPAEKRVYLTLCGWKSDVPRLALEAVISRHREDPIDVESVIDSLLRTSIIESKGKDDGNEYLIVPLASFVFGARKLRVDPYKYVIEQDVDIMRLFGASRYKDGKEDAERKVDILIKAVAQRVVYGQEALENYREILEFIARRVPYAWYKISELYEQANGEHEEKAIQYAYMYLECDLRREDRIRGWRRIAHLQMQKGDIFAQAMALVELNQMAGLDYEEICQIVSEVNQILRYNKDNVAKDKREIIFRKLLEVMEKRQKDANADNYAQMAWLAVNIRDMERAERYYWEGHGLDPENNHIDTLKQKFGWRKR